jgi:acyl carrier protein
MPDQAPDVKSQIRQFILETARSKGVMEVADDQSLTECGALNSLGVFRVVQFLEDTFGFTIHPSEMIPENFTTIDQLDRFATRKIA